MLQSKNNVNHSKKFKEILKKSQIQTKISVPNRSHQMHYEEHQNLYGIIKILNFYNNSTNDQYKIKCVLNNNYYNHSCIIAEIKKTNLSKCGLVFENFHSNLFEGTCEEANEIFEALKKEFYDPHIKIPVPPKQ